jgi:hypothetical protein
MELFYHFNPTVSRLSSHKQKVVQQYCTYTVHGMVRSRIMLMRLRIRLLVKILMRLLPTILLYVLIKRTKFIIMIGTLYFYDF